MRHEQQEKKRLIEEQASDDVPKEVILATSLGMMPVNWFMLNCIFLSNTKLPILEARDPENEFWRREMFSRLVRL